MGIQILADLNQPRDDPVQVGRIGVIGYRHRPVTDDFRPSHQFCGQKIPIGKKAVGMQINHEILLSHGGRSSIPDLGF
jgi:hypothetical protein